MPPRPNLPLSLPFRIRFPSPSLSTFASRPFYSTSTSTMGTASSTTVDTSARVTKLRELMQKPEYNVHAFVVPSEDQHSSEYLATCDLRRGFISGFNGSAGCAIVTLNDALLFTDGRYFLQAEKQLDKNWSLMKQGLPDVPTWQEYLSKVLAPSSRIGIDPTLIAAVDAETISKALEPRNSTLVSLPENLVDIVWGSERPARPKNSVFHLDVKFSGQSHEEKIKDVREKMQKKNAKAYVVTMLDEVAWLFNLRGSDIIYNPVFFAYAVITQDKAILFMDNQQLENGAKSVLDSSNEVEILPYEAFLPFLKDLSNTMRFTKESPILLGDRSSLAVVDAIGSKESALIKRSLVADMKSVKNPVELDGFRKSHIRDGVALARYFAWLEEQLQNGVVLNEWEGAEQLEKFRSELDLFKGLSFDTISSAGPNAAVIHYSPTKEDCATIRKDQVYLCDSGAQFLDGTTDVTRTWHFGTPTDEEKRAFTRVLQGHIAIDTAVVPNGTTGYIIDSFARRYLWQEGWDYRHGTGHGVGHFLNVHEGPQGIGSRISLNSAPLKAGMTVSNEPGYYADGRFGIRIESIVLVKDVKTPNNFGDKGYLGFECVTMCPIQTKMIDKSILSIDEIKWVNDYHKETFEKVSPYLKNDEKTMKWLERECAAI